MIHKVGQRRLPWPAAIATVGYLLIILTLLGAASPFSMTARQMEQRVIAQIWAHGRPTVSGAVVYLPESAPPATTNRYQRTAACYRATWFGEQVKQVYYHSQPRFDLPQSPYGNSEWNPITDDIKWEPFLAPGLGYYTGTLHAVDTSAELDTAIATAVDTDIIEIAATATISTSSAKSFRNRGDAGWVLIRTDQTSWLTTTAADRVAEADSTNMPTLETTSTASFLLAAQGARGWDLRGLHFHNGGATTAQNPAAGLLRFRAATQTQVSHMPTYLNVDKCLFTNPYTPASPRYCRRAIVLGGEFQLVKRSAVYRICENGPDTQAVWQNDGVGKSLVEDCTLEAQGEIIYWGGAVQAMGAASTLADCCVRYCYLFRSADLINGTDVKNVHINFGETKHGNRILIDTLYCDGHLGTRQQLDWNWGGKPQAASEQAYVILQNLTQRYCHCTNSAGPGQVLCTPSDQGYSTSLNGVQRIEIYHLLTDNPLMNTTQNRWQIGSGVYTNVRHLNDVVVRNTTTSGGQGGVYCVFSVGGTVGGSTATDTMSRLVWSDNIGFGPMSTTGPFFRTGGTTNDTILSDIAPSDDYTVKYNVQRTANWGTVLTNSPNFNAKAASLAAIGFVDEANDNYELDAGSAYKGLSTIPGNDPGVYWDGLQARLAGITS